MGKFKNIPPDQRPNWHKLNEGQRRYAFEQYNLALVRRGLPIDHPIPGNSQPPAETERPGYRSATAHEERQLQQLFEDGDEEAINRILQESNGQNVLQDHSESDIEDILHQLDSDMADPAIPDSSVGGKRPANEQLSSEPKRVAAVGKTSLPGTGGDQNARGQQISQGGPRGYELPDPRPNIHSHIRYFKKVHRFFTWGFAYRMITSTADRLFMSTPLAELPWNWLYLYLNQSEHASLPRGSAVDHVRVKVIQRNVRVAFPTNSTASNLATLNQNKNIIYAVGLNKRMPGLSMRYSGFQDGQPMIPNGIQTPVYANHDTLAQEMYSFRSRADFETNTPRHQAGIPQVIPHYFVLVHTRGTVAGQTAELDGWPCLQEHYHEFDADSTTGQCILEHSYNPRVGLITLPKIAYDHNLPVGNVVVNRGSHRLTPQTQTFTRAVNATSGRAQLSSVAEADNPTSALVGGLGGAFSLNTSVQIIEKSQVYYKGLFKQPAPVAQESIHIGVQPTFALTSANLVNDQTNSSFTDTQAYFEVVAECQVNTNFHSEYPLSGNLNNYTDEMWWQADSAPNVFNQMFCGLYTR